MAWALEPPYPKELMLARSRDGDVFSAVLVSGHGKFSVTICMPFSLALSLGLTFFTPIVAGMSSFSSASVVLNTLDKALAASLCPRFGLTYVSQLDERPESLKTYRANIELPPRMSPPKHPSERAHLDRVAHRRASPMTFDVDRFIQVVEPSFPVRLSDSSFLGLTAGKRDSICFPVTRGFFFSG